MTPFMGLTLPTVGVTLGPLWATEVNAAFTVVDEHNHTIGKGVPIPTAGLSINADLPLNSFNLTLARALLMNNNASPLSTPTDITNLYASGGNLWYNNAIGQQIQITAGAGLNAASVGGFGGDYGTSTASAFYTSITSTFTFWQAPNVSALMDVGATTIHPSNSSVNGITLQSPTALSSSYSLTLPVSLPSVTSFLTVSAAGLIGDTIAPDNSTLQFSGSVLQVKPAGITGTQVASATLPFTTFFTSNIFISGGSGSFSTTSTSFTGVTNLSGTFSNSGARPVEVWLQPDGSASPGVFVSTVSNNTISVQIQRNSSVVYTTSFNSNQAGGSNFTLPCSIIRFVDYTVSGTPQSLTYTVFVKSGSGGNLQVLNTVLGFKEIL